MQRDVPAVTVCHDPLPRIRVFLDLALELPGELPSSPLPGSIAVAVGPLEWHDLAPAVVKALLRRLSALVQAALRAHVPGTRVITAPGPSRTCPSGKAVPIATPYGGYGTSCRRVPTYVRSRHPSGRQLPGGEDRQDPAGRVGVSASLADYRVELHFGLP
jgi:hypothetical protein